MAGEALALMEAIGVDLSGVETDLAAPTGVALITVDPTGENQIVVAAGANHMVTPEQLPQRIEGPLIVQLELPIETVEAAVGRATGFVCANLAPAAPVSELLLRRADLIVVNETEAAFYGDGLHRGGGRVVVTKGARGAAMYQRGVEMAWASAPVVEAVDATGAGDAFVGAITVALLDGLAPEEALRFACAAGALITPLISVDPNMGLPWLVNSFMLVMVAGVSFPGLLAASLILGGAQVVVSTYASPILGGMTIVVAAALVLRISPKGFSRA